MKKTLFLVSWVLLLLMAAAVAFSSLASLSTAYFGSQDNLTGQATVEKLREIGGEEAVDAQRGRRATAATWALGWSLLAALIILVPYRAGHLWAWWALFMSVGLSQLLALARVAFGIDLAGNPSAILLGIAAVALAAGAPRMFARPEAS